MHCLGRTSALWERWQNFGARTRVDTTPSLTPMPSVPLHILAWGGVTAWSHPEAPSIKTSPPMVIRGRPPVTRLHANLHICWDWNMIQPFWSQVFLHTGGPVQYKQSLKPTPEMTLLSTLPGSVASQNHNLRFSCRQLDNWSPYSGKLPLPPPPPPHHGFPL